MQSHFKPSQSTATKGSAEAGFLPYGRQLINEEDIAAVCEVLRSDFITSGPKTEEFEHRFAKLVGAKYAIAVNSATAALHLAMRVANLGPGDRVVTSPNTFLASSNSAAYVGAIPDFADIDPVSYNLHPQYLEQSWQPDTKAVVAVAYAGQPCNMPEIARIARERGALVVEDASHGVGSRFTHAGEILTVGSHPWADMTVFSFHPVKTMTTGEGGMLTTDREDWATRARQLRSHGMVRNAAEFVDESELLTEKGPWYYEMQELGYNYRITELQCALGLSQLSRLDKVIARRQEIVAQYNAAFEHIPWLTRPGLRCEADRSHISWHLYTLQLDFAEIGKNRTEAMAELRDQGIGSQVLYIPVYLQPWYRKTYGYSAGKCPIAERYYEHALSLPLFPAMTDADVQRVTQAVRALRG